MMFLTLKVYQKEVSELKYTENQYAWIYSKCTGIVNGNILIKFQISLMASTIFQGVTDPSLGR